MYGLLPTAVRDVEGVEYVEKYGLKIGHSSIQGHRPTNEDAHLIDVTSLGEGHAATAVFDGHAGPDAGALHTYIHAYIHAYMHTYMHACWLLMGRGPL